MNAIFGQRLYIILAIIFCFQIAPQSVSAQVVLYLEMMKEEKPIKYYEGQKLSFKSKDFPKDWQEITIGKIIDEEKIITYDGGMLKLEDIIQVRRSRAWAYLGGTMLQTFGTTWLVFGGIAHVATDEFSFGPDTAIIGGSALLSGWILKKLFRYKKYKIGKKNRLKILDLSWPAPTGQ